MTTARTTARTKTPRSAAPPLAALLATAAVVVAAVGAGAAGCGNYSNEDLEFVNAIPQHGDVEVSVPRRAAVLPANAAKTWRVTWDFTRGFNAAATAFLSLVDGIRSTYPTSGEGDLRIWGPFPAENNPGWQFEFRMVRHREVEPIWFDYLLVMIPPPGVDAPTGPEVEIISGRFSSSGGVRQGVGNMTVTIDEARAAGIVFLCKNNPNPDCFANMRGLEIAYDNTGWPRTMHVKLTNVDNSATFDYARHENGDSTMVVTLTAPSLVPGPLGDDTLRIASRWLASGQGRYEHTVTAGDGLGSMRAECWDTTFQSTYYYDTWDLFGLPEGDPASCIPAL